MRRTIYSGLFLTVGAFAQASQHQVSIPQIGMARFADGSIHQVDGIAANFLVRSRVRSSADKIWFSSTAALTAVNGVIRLYGAGGALLGKYKSQESDPVLAVDSSGPASAAIWLPSLHTLLSWSGTGFVSTVVDDSAFGGGRATAVSVSGGMQAQFLVARPDSSVVRVSATLPTGAVTSVDIVPGANGWALNMQGWLLSWHPRGLLAAQASGNTQTLALSQTDLASDDLTMEQMSDHWLHVYSRSLAMNWAVFVDSSSVTPYLLPPPRPVERPR